MQKKQYEIEFSKALRNLKIFIQATDPELYSHPEFLAMITHWLSSEDGNVPFVARDLSDLWARYLAGISVEKAPLESVKDTVSPGITKEMLSILYSPEPDTTNRFPFPPTRLSEFNFIDLFAGIGGFNLALQEHGGSCVFACEWDKSAKLTYFRNYAKVPYGDIRQFTSGEIEDEQIERLIPDHEVLAAGFPCQPFSSAGVSARNALQQNHGFACETQGTLFFDIMRIARAKRPRILFLENVGNLVKHDGGRTFEVIQSIITNELGYSFNYAIIDAQNYVPQRRKRCYMVCISDKDMKFKFPPHLFEGEPKKLKSILESDADPSYTISQKLWDGHIRRTRRNIARGTGFTAYLADLEKPSNTLVARYGKDGKECLIGQNGSPPRMLTVREAARLQGFPEEFIPASSKTQAYRQFGNSVAVPVVSALAREIVAYL